MGVIGRVGWAPRPRWLFGILSLIGALFGHSPAWAEDGAATIDTGDTAWVLTSSALVLAMTMPGLALFYGGLVRSKNVLGTIVQSVAILALVTLIWVLFGYSLAFGPDVGGIVGNLDWILLSGVGYTPHPVYGSTIPHQAFMVFQLMFAAITPALITGAFAERMKFSAVLLFSGIWAVLIYCPLAHWVWGGGWMGKMGGLDFAGGAVVHISSGTAALACAFAVGPRKGYGTDYMAPHNLPMTILGAGLLWFGWFGFNAGSALGANANAISAFVATHTAAATATFVWILVEWRHRGKPTALGAATGAIAGLATVTPASGYIGVGAAIVVGLIAGLACYFAIVVKGKFGYDDALDVVGVHGAGGVLGILAVGLFATKAVNAAGADGLFYGNPGQLWIQSVVAAVTLIFSFVGSFVILKIVDATVGLRVPEDQEVTGLDLTQHNERAYS